MVRQVRSCERSACRFDGVPVKGGVLVYVAGRPNHGRTVNADAAVLITADGTMACSLAASSNWLSEPMLEGGEERPGLFRDPSLCVKRLV
ncbi:MAG: hypothetical protein D6690_04150 [Nitrospirae bacterium]|nr:MAG: hypothetical protein D6690_04150 [Nitrospirota bacterium]